MEINNNKNFYFFENEQKLVDCEQEIYRGIVLDGFKVN